MRVDVGQKKKTSPFRIGVSNSTWGIGFQKSGPKAKKNNTLVSGKAGDERNLHPGGRKKLFFINLIEIFQQSVHLKNYCSSTFFYCFKGKKENLYE